MLINQYYLIAQDLGKSKKTEDEEKVKKLYTYAKLRKFDIAERTKRELEKKEKLEKDNRVVKILTISGLTNATRDAIGGVLVGFLLEKEVAQVMIEELEEELILNLQKTKRVTKTLKQKKLKLES